MYPLCIRSAYRHGHREKGADVKVRAMLVAVVVLLLSIGTPAYALDEGVPDGDRHPNVGLLGFDADRDGPEPVAVWCSGSVLSDRHFLTAAHCIVPQPPDVEWVVTLDPGSPAAPVYRPGVIWDDFPLPLTGPAVRGGVATVHPAFDADTVAHDVAVVTFPPGSFSGVAPVAVARTGLVDRLPKRQPLRLVGYGVDPERADGAPVFVAEGYRQTRTTSITGVTRRQIHLKGGPCLGDSGSPQLLPNSNVAVALFSSGNNDTCAGPFLSQRLDTRSERRFLAGFVRLS